MKHMNVSTINTRASLLVSRTIVALSVLLAVCVIATVGFILLLTAHAQAPAQTDLNEGGGAPGEIGGGTSSVSITASPSSIERGYSSQLTFSSSYVTRCAIDNGVGVVAANRSDVRVVSPTQTTTYRISCDGPLQDLIDEVTVTVVVPAPPPPPSSSVSVSLASNPESISSGSASTLSWSSSGVTSCSINQGVGSVTANASGSRSVSPTQSATYVITCTTGQPSPGPTWQYSYSDISDLSCPVTQNASVYTNVPNCPYSPQGKSCTSGSCKINRANQSTCSIETDVYECVSSGSSTESSVSSATTVTVTQVPDLVGQVGGAVTATANQAVTLYGGVANQGMGDAGYFPNIVQVCDTNCATVNQVLAATAIDPLDAGGWQQVSAAYTPTTASAQFYRVCANNNTSWVNVHTESNYANNCSGWQYLTVGALTPDLTAGAISPTTATRGQAQTVSGTVTNIGNAAAGVTTGYFELTAPAAKNSTTASVSIPALSAGVSGSGGFSYSFPTSGTYSVRLCADWLGQVTESNEANNCGPWTDISVTGQVVPSSVSCTVNTQSAVVGGSVTYDTSAVGAATSPYGWTGSDGTTGYGTGSTATRTFTAPGTYGMQVTATNAASAAQCPLVTVAAGWCTAGTPVLTIAASPARVRAGQSSTIIWSATSVNGQNADCTVTGPGISWGPTAVSAAPVCSTSGSATATINTQSTYTLACEGQTKSATVNVIPNFQEF